MKNLYFLLLLCSLLLLSICSQSQTLSAVVKKDYQSGSNDIVNQSVYSPASGSIYIAGNIETPPSGPGGTTGNTRSFLSRFDSLGNEQWSIMENVQPSGANFYIYAIAADANDNVFITGYYKGNLTFAGYTMPYIPTSGYGYFVGKVSSAGQALWMSGGTTTTGNGWTGLDIKTDDAGNVYVLASFKNTVSVGGFSFTAPVSNSKNLVIKYDNAGTLISATEYGPFVNSSSGFTKILLGNSNTPSIYLSGTQSGTTTIGGNTIVSNNNSMDAMMMKTDNSGNPINLIHFGGTATDNLSRLISSPDNSIIAAGEFYGTLQVGASSYTATGSLYSDAYIMKLDTNLNMEWMQVYGCAHQDYIYGITTDQNANIYIAGEMRNSLTIGSTTLNYTSFATTGSNACLLKFDANGQFLFGENTTAVSTGTTYNSYQRGKSIAVTPAGTRILFFGEFAGNMYMGGANLSTTVVNRIDAFVTSYAPPSPLALNDLRLSLKLRANKPLLEWQASEGNAQAFGIERSCNGADFSILTQVAANAGANQGYSYLDADLTDAKVLYYRIKSISAAGAISYSNIHSIAMENEMPACIVFPNPAAACEGITISAQQEIAAVELYSMDGRLVRTEYYDQPKTAVTLKGNKPGSYLVRVRYKEGCFTINRVNVY